MLATTPGEPSTEFGAPSGIAFTDMDETSGGLAMPECPRNVVVTAAFKEGTQPTNPCPIHSPQYMPPAVDQFGIPINLDTAPPTTTEGGFTEPPITPPDSTLTGGVFRTETTATAAPPPPPPPTPVPAPPPITTTPIPAPPPTATNTSAPPTSTSTAPPPR